MKKRYTMVQLPGNKAFVSIWDRHITLKELDEIAEREFPEFAKDKRDTLVVVAADGNKLWFGIL